MSISARSLSSRTDPLVAGLDAVLHRVIQLVWLNVCWLLLTLLGGVVLGIGPATVAAHTVAIRWVRGEQDVAVGRTMWDQWRGGWRTAAPFGPLCLALAVSLGATWWISRGQSPMAAAVTQGLALLLGLLLLCTVPHLAWVITRTQSAGRPRVGHVFAAALAVGVGRPVLTLVLLLVAIGWPTALIAAGWPGLLPVCGASVPLAAGAWCIERALPRESDRPEP